MCKLKNIFIVINDISKVGGISRVALNLYTELKKYYDVKIITGNLNKDNFDYYKNAEKDLINLNIGSPHKLSSRIKLLFWYINFYRKIKKLNINKQDVVIGIETYINFIGSTLNSKKILTEHTSFKRRFFTQLLKFIFYKRADYLVVLTEDDKKFYKKFLDNVLVIPNFIYPSDKVSLLNTNHILYVGHINEGKGKKFLCEIIKHTSWDYKLVGNGDIECFKNLKNVILKGEILDVEKEYLSSDIFIMTSKKEGFPMVLLEAKNYGLPIVCFDIPGTRAIVRDNIDGFLVEFGNINKFIEKVDLLMRDYNLRKKFQIEAKKDIKKYYPNKVIKKWKKIIEY